MNKKMVEQNLRLSLLDLEIEESRQISCPFCGAVHERSLGITRLPSGIVYRCWRASCGERGFIRSSAVDYSPHWEKQQKKTYTPKPFEYETTSLPKEYRRMFYERYLITDEELDKNGFLYSPEINRVVMPIFNQMGYKVGVVARSYSKKLRGPKAINYLEDGRPHLHYPPALQPTTKRVVLVEDIPSAIRVGRHARSVALLGHSLCNKTAEDLANTAAHLVVALDPDATAAAIKLKSEYQVYFNSIQVRVTSADPKDMTDEQILQEVLE